MKTDYIFETGAVLILFWFIICFLGLAIYTAYLGYWVALLFVPPLLVLLVMTRNLWNTRPSLRS
jgi:hypothetical protein